jgi:hypothetical protein
VRTSLIVVVSVTLLVSLAIYGSNGNFNLSGKWRTQRSSRFGTETLRCSHTPPAFYPNHRTEMDISPSREPVLSKAVRR